MNSGHFDSTHEIQQTERTSALETAHLARRARRADYKILQRKFGTVVAAYTANRAMPFLCAVNLDADADTVTKSHRHTAATSLWARDVELSTEAALRGRPDLQRGWFDLALGKVLPPKLTEEIITKCGRLYRTRGIEPSAWYRPSYARGRCRGAA